MLTPLVVQKVQREGSTYTQSADNCTILIAELAGFTPLSEHLTAPELVSLLNQIFSRFAQLALKQELEKIKTIGDGYLVVCGSPKENPNHAHPIVNLAQDMLIAIKEFDGLSIRIGINTGTVIAGTIGQTRIAIDLWRSMESHGVNGRIQLTEDTHALIKDDYFDPPRVFDVKGKGEMQAFLLAEKGGETEKGRRD